MTLHLVSTDELLEELKRRYPLLVVIATADISRDCLCELILYNGDVAEILLAMEVAKSDLLTQYREGSEIARDNP